MHSRSAGMTAIFVLLSIPSFAKTQLGIDTLRKDDFALLQDANVALITNHTGVDSEGSTTVDLFSRADNFTLQCILSPEHGFKGTLDHGEAFENTVDEKTGVPIFSLYGKTSRPTDAMLEGVDTIVFDIQDIGTRFYTYITTMGMALEEASKRKLRFIVLDRPNPIRGDIVEGDILASDIKRLTGYFSIPTRHGLTVGELALWMNKRHNLQADLVVVPVKKWLRTQWFDQTGLIFPHPSPNIRSLTAAILYSGIGCFEATNISVGRGTETPFKIIGAPWINGKALAAYLREKNLPGILVEPVNFTPDKDIYKDTPCSGIRFIVTDRNIVRPFQVFVYVFKFLYHTHPKNFKPDWEEIRVVTDSDKLRETIEDNTPTEELLKYYEQKVDAFVKETTPFFLYQ